MFSEVGRIHQQNHMARKGAWCRYFYGIDYSLNGSGGTIIFYSQLIISLFPFGIFFPYLIGISLQASQKLPTTAYAFVTLNPIFFAIF